MEEPSIMKDFFQDITRTLLSSALFLDYLHLNLQPDSDVLDDWICANEHIMRAFEIFLEVRSTCFGLLGSLDLAKKRKLKTSSLNPKINNGLHL